MYLSVLPFWLLQGINVAEGFVSPHRPNLSHINYLSHPTYYNASFYTFTELDPRSLDVCNIVGLTDDHTLKAQCESKNCPGQPFSNVLSLRGRIGEDSYDHIRFLLG